MSFSSFSTPPHTRRPSASSPYSGYVFQEASISSASLSTNATAPGLIGAGRTIGIFYDLAGHLLERLVNERFANAETAGKVVLFQSPSSTHLSVDSNETASNLVGPGRVLGLAYDAAGRGLEKHLNSLANRFGYGPGATVQRIKSRWSIYLQDMGPTRTLNDLPLTQSKKRKLEKKCKRLLEYAR